MQSRFQQKSDPCLTESFISFLITAARELWDLVPEEEGDDLNLFKINALDVRSHLHPEVTDPQQLLDDTLDFIQEIARRLDDHRARREEQN